MKFKDLSPGDLFTYTGQATVNGIPTRGTFTLIKMKYYEHTLHVKNEMNACYIKNGTFWHMKENREVKLLLSKEDFNKLISEPHPKKAQETIQEKPATTVPSLIKRFTKLDFD